MAEKIITIRHIEPIEIFGVNDEKFNHIRQYFPKLRLVARGDEIKAMGEEKEILVFERKLKKLVDAYYIEGILSIPIIDRYLQDEENRRVSKITPEKNQNADIILFGVSGSMIKARTPGQRKMVHSLENNDVIFAIGPAGTGKTYLAVVLAVRAWKNKEVKRIILTRPAVEAGENLGFLPGDMKEKLDPYMQPLYDALYDMIPAEKLNQLIEARTIQIAPLAFMRGRTLDHAFVILDEAQNTTESQMKMFLTRMGTNAKFIITGDVTQIDLPNRQPSGLIQAMRILRKIKGIDFIHLGKEDVVRHPLVKEILDSYEKNEQPKS
ncbi:MAG: PhoH family protein [Bacteroidia bacterium]|nr:PhoH family protein [Bacteroidia bacterium]